MRSYRFLLPVVLVAASAGPIISDELVKPVGPKAAIKTDLYGDPLPEGAIARLGTPRWRHISEPECVARSPDGKLVASGGYEGLYLWDAATGRMLHSIPNLRSARVAFTPDSKSLLAAGLVGIPGKQELVLHRYELESFRRLEQHTLGKIEVGMNGSYTGDAKLLAVASSGRVGVWETVTGKRLFDHQDKKDWPWRTAFSSDGKVLATGGFNAVTLWDLAKGEKIRRIQADGLLVGLQFSPDDRWLATAGDRLRLWDASTGKEVWNAPKIVRSNVVAFSPDGKVLACDSLDGLHLLDAATGQEQRRFAGPFTQYARHLTFSSDGKVLLSAGPDDLIGLWDPATGKPLHDYPGHRSWVSSLAFSPDGKEPCFRRQGQSSLPMGCGEPEGAASPARPLPVGLGPGVCSRRPQHRFGRRSERHRQS